MAAATATALRVLASALERGFVVDRPSLLDVTGQHLTPIEITWLAQGMPDADVAGIPGTGSAENMQLVGTVAGRLVRVRLLGSAQAGLIGDLRQLLDRRTKAATR